MLKGWEWALSSIIGLTGLDRWRPMDTSAGIGALGE